MQFFKQKFFKTAVALLISFSANAQFHGDILVDAGPCAPIVPLVCPGGVENPLFAVDGDRNNFAVLKSDFGLNSNAFLEIGFSTLGQGGDVVQVDLQNNDGDLSIELLQSVVVEVFDSSGTLIGGKSNFNLTDIHLISGPSLKYRFYIESDTNSNNVASVRITLNGFLDVLKGLRVYDASYINKSSVCGAKEATILNDFQNIDNPENAVSVNVNDYALLNLPVGVLNDAFLDLEFVNSGYSGDFIGFEIEPNNTALAAGVIANTTITAYNAAGEIVDENGDFEVEDLTLISNTSDRYQMGFETTTDSTYDIARIRITVAPTASVLVDLRIYNGYYFPNGGNISISTNTGGTSICSGSKIILTADPDYPNFLWSTGETTQSITVTEGGIYTVSSVVDGCVFSISIFIEELDFTAEFNASTLPDCGMDNGVIDVEVTDGSGAYGYLWSNGETTQDLNNVAAGIYTLEITDSATLCSQTLIVPVSNNDRPTVNFDVTDADCPEDNGSIALFVDGDGPFTYEWYHGEDEREIFDLAQGTYYVQVTDAEGCITAMAIYVDSKTDLGLTYQVVEPGCDSTNGSIDLSVGNGSGNYSFLWSSGQISEDLDSIPSGLYTVEVTDNQTGCVDMIMVPVSGAQGPEINLVELLNETCFGDNDGAIEISVEPSGSTINFWSNGMVGPDRIENLSPDTYWVRVEDFANNQCASYEVYEVEEAKAILSMGEVKDNCSNTEFADGEINLIVTGGTSPYSYLWSNNATTQDLFDLDSGSYSVVITDANGCELAKSFVVGISDCPISLEDLVIPDVFTPNGDGTNDTWQIDGLEAYPNHSVSIFNRWGSVVNESTPYQEWRGTFRTSSDRVPDGTYFYSIELGDTENTVLTGFVQIVR